MSQETKYKLVLQESYCSTELHGKTILHWDNYLARHLVSIEMGTGSHKILVSKHETQWLVNHYDLIPSNDYRTLHQYD